MSDYMKSLRTDIGYVSLKEQYSLEMAKLYNILEGNINVTTPDDIDWYVAENWEEIEEDITTQDDRTDKNSTKSKYHIEVLEKKVQVLVKEIPELKN